MTVTKEMLTELSEAPLATLVKTNCTDVSAMWSVAAQAQREADITFLRDRSSRSAEAGKPVVKGLEGSTLRIAAFNLLERCTEEFGWDVDAGDSAPVSDDEDCCIRWGDLRKLHAALSPPADTEPELVQMRYRMINGGWSNWITDWRGFSWAYDEKLIAEGEVERRGLYAAPCATDGAHEALRLVAEYDDLLRKHEGPSDTLFAGDVVEIDEAYDRMVDACRAALYAAPVADRER